MKFKSVQTLQKIANLIDATFVGESDFKISGINEIHVVEAGDIVFVDHPKYYEKALNSEATIILINKEVDCPKGKSLLISDNPFRDFNKITKHFSPFISSKVSIADTAIVGEGTIIQPNVFIGNNVSIGKNCLIHPNVTIYDNAIIGDAVIIHANTVLGADAFYYKNRPEGFDQLLSVGRVVVKASERQHQYGYAIMKASIEAIQHHFKSGIIKISAQTYLKRFYNNLEFFEVGGEYLEDGIPHIGMLKT